MEVDKSTPEAVLVEEFELEVVAVRERRCAAADEDRDKEEMELVEEARAKSGRSERRATDTEVAPRRFCCRTASGSKLCFSRVRLVDGGASVEE